MKQEIERAIDFCIEALNNHKPGSQEVEGNDKAVLETIRKIKELPYNGRGLGIGDDHNGYRETFEGYLRRFGGELSYSLYWLDAILVLYDFSGYTEAQMLESAQNIVNDNASADIRRCGGGDTRNGVYPSVVRCPRSGGAQRRLAAEALLRHPLRSWRSNIMFNHILKHIITNLVMLDDVEQAERYIPYFKKTVIFKEEDNLDMGYLILLNYFAQRGDDKNFFRYFKQSKPAINKHEVSCAKGMLVGRFAAKNGIEEAIALCRHKNLGTGYYISALSALAGQGKYMKLKEIFGKYPELKQPEKETELITLSQAYLEAKEQNMEVDDDFELLFGRALHVDRKLRWGDIKLLDFILFDLGLAEKNNREHMIRCRKAIKHNSLKKELMDITTGRV